MTDFRLGKRKVGDVFCDMGKYMLTVIPFTYFMSDKDGILSIIMVLVFVGILFLLFGLYFVSHSSSETMSGYSCKRKIKVLKNSVFVVEEEQQK